MIDPTSWHELALTLELSPRMLEILQGIFDDKTEFAIATDLSISEHTVHTYLERLRHKLDACNRVQIILRITEEYLQLQRQAARPVALVISHPG